ncbi:MAG: aminotransferase [Beijerinckiaceae bacterium]|nr:aminotransferase [Beijerinckiaceae bacterium]
MISFNPLVRDTGSPPIPEAQGWAKRYNGSHGPLIDLSQAVPGYPPHPDLLKHLADAAGTTAAAKYGDIYGDQSLRDVLATELTSLYRGKVGADEIAITSGCNQAFVLVAMALAKAGDNILLPSPWYFNHQMTLNMLGVEPRALPARPENNFIPDPKEAEALIDASTRAIVLVTPNNPTGAIYPPATIAAFAALCRKKGIWLIVDETYRDFLPEAYGQPHKLFDESNWQDNILSLYSFSKSYCIPGHRVGAIIGGKAILDEIGKVIDCVQICAPRAAQTALTWAIPSLNDWRISNTREITNRASAFREAMAALPGWQLNSIGAYFAYVTHPFKETSVFKVAEKLAAERGVLGLPGPWFGPSQDNHLRLAFANVGVDSIREIPNRLKEFKV